MRSTRNMKRYQAVKKPAFVSRKVRETNGLERVPSYRQPLKKASYSRARLLPQPQSGYAEGEA